MAMSEAESGPDAPTNRWRKWLFRFVAMTLVPAAFLLAWELGLRLAGYGHDSCLFALDRQEGVWRTQPEFGWRFFLRELAPQPVGVSFPAEKAPGAYRIFIMGGSAAQGSPATSFGFWRILERMLRRAYPEGRFEVVNTAMTAINSHVLLPIARECGGRKPDLFVIYAGNNEVVGPFGPATVFAEFCPSLRLIRASLWVRSTRIGQLLRALLVGPVTRQGEESELNAGLPMFAEKRVAPHDARMEAVHHHFRRNLNDIVSATTEAGAKVLLCTVATNLRHCAPFASMHRPDLEPAERQHWDRLYQEGVAAESAGDYQAAVARYLEARQTDETYADLHYRLGRCYLALERFEKAREHYVRARDLDALQLRATKRINEIIREVAGTRADSGVVLVDIAEEFSSSELAPHGLPGEELFLEHVHPTFVGNYLLARSVFGKVRHLLPPHAREEAEELPVLSLKEAAEALVLTGLDGWRIAAKVVRLMEKPPFTGQLDHNERLAAARQRERHLTHYARLEAVDRALATYRRALRREPNDHFLRMRLAQYMRFRERLTGKGGGQAATEPAHRR